MAISKEKNGSRNIVRFTCGNMVPIALASFNLILTEDVDESTLEFAVKGHIVAFGIKQDEHGGHSFSWPTNVKNAEAIALEPGAVTQQLFLFDGQFAWPLAPAWTSAKRPEPSHLSKVEATDSSTPAVRREKRNFWAGKTKQDSQNA
jgi:hypothetical protein